MKDIKTMIAVSLLLVIACFAHLHARKGGSSSNNPGQIFIMNTIAPTIALQVQDNAMAISNQNLATTNVYSCAGNIKNFTITSNGYTTAKVSINAANTKGKNSYYKITLNNKELRADLQSSSAGF
jgi:hypothetical protein